MLSAVQIRRKREFEATMARNKTSLLEDTVGHATVLTKGVVSGSTSLLEDSVGHATVLTKGVVSGSASMVRKGFRVAKKSGNLPRTALLKGTTSASDGKKRIQQELASLLRV
jgi:hypothetical protein